MKDVAKFISQELKPYKATIFFCIGLAIVAAILDTAAPVALGRGFDFAGKGLGFAIYGAALASWFGLRVVADRIRSRISYQGNVIGANAAESFILRSQEMVMRKPLSFHYGKKSGDVIERINMLAWRISEVVLGVVFDLLPALLATMFILAYVVLLDWLIASVLAASIAAFIAYVYWTLPTVLANRTAWNDAERKLRSFGYDALRNMLVIKSTTNESYIGNVLRTLGKEKEAAVLKDSVYDRHVLNVQNGIIAVGSALAVTLAVRRFTAGSLTFGVLTAITAFAFSIFGYVRNVQSQLRTYLRLIANHKAYEELAVEAEENFSSGIDSVLRGTIEFRQVRFRYREDRPILEDASFEVKAGQRVAIVGESGEGKTTLVDLLGRYYEPQGGGIFFDGRHANDVNLRSLRQQMAYVPQDLTLFHESLGYNIRFGRPDATDDEVQLAAKRAHLEAFINALPEKYETVVGERGLKLSGGERQRVALARAFLRNPKILVLDEPTAHLDSKTEASIQNALEELMKGRTTFIIAHRLRTVRDADVILVLKDGRIAESGTHNELATKNGAYASLLKAQGGFITPDEKHL